MNVIHLRLHIQSITSFPHPLILSFFHSFSVVSPFLSLTFPIHNSRRKNNTQIEPVQILRLNLPNDAFKIEAALKFSVSEHSTNSNDQHEKHMCSLETDSKN